MRLRCGPLPYLEELESFPKLAGQKLSNGPAALPSQQRVHLHEGPRSSLGFDHEVLIFQQIGKAQHFAVTMLLGPKKVSLASDTQVLSSDFEAVGGPGE